MSDDDVSDIDEDIVEDSDVEVDDDEEGSQEGSQADEGSDRGEEDETGEENADKKEQIAPEDDEVMVEDQVAEKDDVPDNNFETYIYMADDKRVTSDRITEAEKAAVVGARIAQIESGSRIYTDITGLSSVEAIALKEFNDGRSPLIIIREIYRKKNTIYAEKWKVNELKHG